MSESCPLKRTQSSPGMCMHSCCLGWVNDVLHCLVFCLTNRQSLESSGATVTRDLSWIPLDQHGCSLQRQNISMVNFR